MAGPDEPAHFSYIQRIANDHTLPAFDHGPPDYFSVATNASVYTTGYLPSRTREPLRKLRRDLPAFPPEKDGFAEKNHGALIGVWKYPPAYDLIATPAYLFRDCTRAPSGCTRSASSRPCSQRLPYGSSISSWSRRAPLS